jgi:hypothetical protein
MKAATSCFWILACLLLPSSPGSDSITLGRVPLTLGTPEAQVLAALSGAGYEVQKLPIGRTESWSICERSAPKNSVCDDIGQLFFTSGRLTQVRKIWTPPDTSNPNSELRTIIAMLAALHSQAGDAPCTIATPQRQYDRFSSVETEITCGAHSIQLVLFTGYRGDERHLSEWVDLNEIAREP